MNINRILVKAFLLVLVLGITASRVHAFTLYLDNGTFFGPGKAVYNDTGLVGSTTFMDAQVRNIVLTGPLTGFIPFSNNGAAEPNVIAEELQVGGVVDGLASDGTLINENADTGLRLNFSDPETGESADVMVIAEFSSELPDGGEPIFPDQFGNLTFNPSVLADPGQADQVARFNVSFTTGVAQIPLSLKTQANEVGGQDNAGPLDAGQYIVGRMGDFNHDGFLDGVLVLAANSPLDLLVARGNPIAQIRPWASDIPIDPVTSSVLELRGVALNYSQVVDLSLEKNDIEGAIGHLQSSTDAVRSALENMRIALKSEQLDPLSQRSIRHSRARLRHSYYSLLFSISTLELITLNQHRAGDNRGHLDGRNSARKLKNLSKRIRASFASIGRIVERLAA